MAIFSVEALQARASNKFEDLVISTGENESVTFPSLLRLKPTQRKKLQEELKKVEEVKENDEADVDDLADIFRSILLQVATNKVAAKALLAGADVPFLMVVFEAWIALTQPGEASESQN